ncbi:deoxyribodipyrimidine photo-lyase [Pacificibacter maritimus]|uniref:Deoxyribodipyrimidine photo-lyase n=1 Tax=Pacificibacter maritimus TaxID=762213 RepID=A0A3N4UM82_9RHOB|nr:deoxyribodipyrimidine photo-lyase [Pacificibacter maritimus]RPE71563.1 deoxyribodipyrimidine photo-lyase [Pacificibacter maritimus]
MVTIWWIRRDLRLKDHPALTAAAKAGAVLPVFIRDACVDNLGAAPKWRLGLGLEHLMQEIQDLGGQVSLRSGDPLTVLSNIAQETGAQSVVWSRLYDAEAIDRDTAVKSGLTDLGLTVQSFEGHLLFEPWTVRTKTDGFYKVYSPFWRSVKDTPIADSLPQPDVDWAAAIDTETLSDWQLGAQMRRGANVVLPYTHVGTQAAEARLQNFIENHAEHYKAKRDFPAENVCSGLSENLTYGEISPRMIWHAGQFVMQSGAAGAEHFLKEVTWREFAYHLLYHQPNLATENFREGWDDFPWQGDSAAAERWRQGRTGVKFVDAAMREMYVTGTMHNRARMIVASYLTKHLMTDWRIGRAWFEDCLIDWDPASNAMGWQWVAGCGPDAAPYFRIFNPDGQSAKFDADNIYLDRWLAENKRKPSETALSYFDAIPKSWSISAQDDYPDPMISLADGRNRALEAYSARSS